jgi:hypothetical protein
MSLSQVPRVRAVDQLSQLSSATHFELDCGRVDAEAHRKTRCHAGREFVAARYRA